MTKVADFLVEIGTEELPTKEIQTLAVSFAANIHTYLSDAGILHTQTKTYATPRRIAVLISNLAAEQPEQTISKLGPAKAAAYNPDGSPTKATTGFAASCGATLDEITTIETEKGPRLYFEKKQPGKKTPALMPTIIEKSLSQLPVKKYMRWGNGELSFVRPIHWILMLYGKDVINATIWGIATGNYTRGHRIHCPKPIKISTPENYERLLETEGKVIADFEKRKSYIKAEVIKLATQAGCVAVIDPELLTMITGLVENPVALMAQFDASFLRVPKECLISAMQEHQKCFAMVDNNGQLLPKFILISNINSTDPNTVIKGNELVMQARLADAAFYYDKDQQQPLANRVEQLKTVIYQKKLGSLYDKTIRIQAIAVNIATKLQIDIETAKRAAFLCKADLLTNMVYEFPELQGTMGYYYAKHDHETDTVATAIAEHYKPKFAQDALPGSIDGICVALADRLDSLVGMFGIGNIPTGEKDPYALRRQALAVLRILIYSEINLDLQDLFGYAIAHYSSKIDDHTNELLEFFFERLKAWYSSEGIPTKTFAAVHATNITNPLDFHRRINAVTKFQALPAAASLAAANKRVQNLLEKNIVNMQNSDLKIAAALISSGAEQELYTALQAKEDEIKPLLKNTDYTAILQALAVLQEPVDNFFNSVMVMVDDAALRNNRLNLLQRLRNLFLQVADVSLL